MDILHCLRGLFIKTIGNGPENTKIKSAVDFTFDLAHDRFKDTDKIHFWIGVQIPNSPRYRAVEI